MDTAMKVRDALELLAVLAETCDPSLVAQVHALDDSIRAGFVGLPNHGVAYEHSLVSDVVRQGVASLAAK